jgi:hypothetical protein
VRLCNLIGLVQIVRLQKDECGKAQQFILPRRKLGVTVQSRTLKNLPMYILRAFVFLASLAQVLVAQQPTPILPDPNLTPGSTFDVTAQDVCTPGYAKKVRNVPEEMKREVYREYGITSHGPRRLRGRSPDFTGTRRGQFDQKSLAGVSSDLALECSS